MSERSGEEPFYTICCSGEKKKNKEKCDMCVKPLYTCHATHLVVVKQTVKNENSNTPPCEQPPKHSSRKERRKRQREREKKKKNTTRFQASYVDGVRESFPEV